MKKIMMGMLTLLFFLSSCKNKPAQQNSTDSTGHTWWKEAVVYQIYPRSFKDENGDGIGDLKGVISKLDYIKSLGVDVVWLNPIYSSPNDDNGYDISDYRNIMSQFGTMDDFNTLLKGMHDRGIKLMMDLVVNHSSDEHEWFKQARSSRTNPYHDYYHWWPAEKGTPTHRWSYFDANGDAWAYDTLTNSYYLHYFSRKQPDLNWENAKVRKEVFDMMKFWFDKGIDGFRMDVITYISKDTTWPAIPASWNNNYADWYYDNGGHLNDYLKEMNKEVLSKYNCMTVAEAAGNSTEHALEIVNEDNHELNMAFQFEGVSYGYPGGDKFKLPKDGDFKLSTFKAIYSKWDSVFENKGWGTIFLGNHDQPRMLTRRGNDAPEFRDASSKLLTTFILTMRGTPYYYFGDEIGMSNIKFNDIKDYNDIESINHYKLVQSQHGDLKEYMEASKISARDNGRTPMQWDATTNAGFTSGKPWLNVNPNYTNVNVAAQDKDPNSILNYFRKAIRVRKDNKTLVYGKYELLDKDNEKVYAYTRGEGADKILVVLNFSKDKLDWVIPSGIAIDNTPILNNYTSTLNTGKGAISLEPYQAFVVKVK